MARRPQRPPVCDAGVVTRSARGSHGGVLLPRVVPPAARWVRPCPVGVHVSVPRSLDGNALVWRPSHQTSPMGSADRGRIVTDAEGGTACLPATPEPGQPAPARSRTPRRCHRAELPVTGRVRPTSGSHRPARGWSSAPSRSEPASSARCSCSPPSPVLVVVVPTDPRGGRAGPGPGAAARFGVLATLLVPLTGGVVGVAAPPGRRPQVRPGLRLRSPVRSRWGSLLIELYRGRSSTDAARGRGARRPGRCSPATLQHRSWLDRGGWSRWR